MVGNMSLRILLLGDGGREHALAWKLANSRLVQAIFVAPGNSGTATARTTANLDFRVDGGNFDSLALLIRDNSINFVVPTREQHLVHGITDFLDGCKLTSPPHVL